MNLILLRPDDFVHAGAVRLSDRRALHLRKVLRARVGDTVRVGLLGGLQGPGRVLALTHERVDLEVQLDEDSPPASRHGLVLALPRPPALRRILRGATALGIKRIALIDSARVEGGFWHSSQIQPDKIEEQLCLGLEQARDTRLPEVSLHRRFRAFVERELPGWLAEAKGIVGHPEAPVPCPVAQSTPTVLIVGPEGGWIDPELAALAAAGAALVSLGPRPLAVETAVIALLGRLAP